MKKLLMVMLAVIMCCSLAFGAVCFAAEAEGTPEVIPVLDHEITQEDWDSAKAYTMTPVGTDTTGATGTVKLLATDTRLYFLMEVQDATRSDNDRPDYTITVGGKTASARGKFIDSANGLPWLADRATDFGKSIKVESAYEDGAWRLEVGYDLGDAFVNGAAVTVDFSAADTTVRPQEPTEGFTASVKDISYNKASAAWNEFEGAETYKFYVYAVNGADAEEPYTHLSIEGPVYAGNASYAEEFLGLSATTRYAIQVVAYDGDDNVIGYSSLAEFETISREEALNPGGDGDEDGDKEPGDEDKEPEDKKGCGSSLTGGAVLAAAALIGVAGVILAKKSRKK